MTINRAGPICPDERAPSAHHNRTFTWPPTLTPQPGHFLNLGSGKDIRPAAGGWVNLDGYVDHPDVVKHDFIETPWPLPDNAFDVVCASHVLEHIPLEYRRHASSERDVLFDVMEEIHRVLRPGGLLHMRTPWGGSREGLGHPQHYRQWRPEWFATFDPGATENYYSTARFRVHSWRRNFFGFRANDAMRLGASRLSLTAHLGHRLPFLRPLLMERGELEAFLVAVKDTPHQPIQNQSQRGAVA